MLYTSYLGFEYQVVPVYKNEYHCNLKAVFKHTFWEVIYNFPKQTPSITMLSGYDWLILTYNLPVTDCSLTDLDLLVSSIITLQVYVPSSPSIR